MKKKRKKLYLNLTFIQTQIMQGEINLLPKQVEAWEYIFENDKITELGYGGGAGGGKTRLGVYYGIIYSELYPGSRGVIGRKELKNLKRTTMATLFEVCSELGYKIDTDYTYNDQTSIFKFSNGSEIIFMDMSYSPQDPEYTRFGSLELTWAWVDESNEVPDKAKAILKTRVGRKNKSKDGTTIKGMWLETFNPNKGHVYNDYYRPWRDGNLPSYRAFVRALPSDNPHLPEAYLEGLRRADTQTRERLLYGNFEYDDDPLSLFKIDSVTDLFTNTITNNNQEKYIIVDVARFGKDRSVISYWNGLILKDIQILRTQSLDITAENVKEMERSYQVPRSCILVDEDGVGGGLLDMLRGAKGFTANSPALETFGSIQSRMIRQNYKNIKAQCWFKLADMVDKHELAIEDNERTRTIRQTLIEELTAMKARPRSDSEPLNVIPKENLKEILGRSTDVADIFMMRMLFVLKTKQAIISQGSFGKHKLPRVAQNI
jgi:phage terminase large subunit